jgi:anti-sigma regulatory factor (Ser/Thr protein kinase)
MRATTPDDVIDWHRKLAVLFADGTCNDRSFLRPFHFVMLALAAKTHNPSELTLPEHLCNYAARMDLWEAIGLEPPIVVGRRDPRGHFLPIQPLHDSETVFATADALAEIARPNAADAETINSLSTALIELLNNCFDHAAVDDNLWGLACAQAWPNGGRAQIAIADAGVGVASLSRNPALRGRLSGNACELATELHVTGDPSGQHAGYGLTLARQLIELNGGTFILLSGQEWVCSGNRRISTGHMPSRSIQIFDRHCSRRLAVVEVEYSTEPRVAIDCALICSHDRGRMDQSVFKTLVVAFSVIVINVFGHSTA